MAEVVVVTGGTAGIGRATAREFAGAGANVAVLARGREKLDSRIIELREDLAALRQIIRPQRELAAELAQGRTPFFRPKLLPYLRDLNDELVRIEEDVRSGRSLRRPEKHCEAAPRSIASESSSGMGCSSNVSMPVRCPSSAISAASAVRLVEPRRT